MNIALIGYGKMGHIIEQVAVERGHRIVCIIDPYSTDERKADFGSEQFRSADIAIEFTTPATAEGNILQSWQAGVPVVSGTTGWDISAFKLQHPDAQQSLIWSSNYSIGVNLFFALNRRLAELMKPYAQYKPAIEEIHHVHKLDAPSGTAKTLAQDAEAILHQPIDIKSIREGEVPGTHTVTYDSPADMLTIRHEAKSRAGFAVGAVIAAEWLAKQPIGYYNMSDLLNI